MAGYTWILCRGYIENLGSCLFDNVSFLSYFVTLAPSVKGFAEPPATLVSRLSCWYSFLHSKPN